VSERREAHAGDVAIRVHLRTAEGGRSAAAESEVVGAQRACTCRAFGSCSTELPEQERKAEFSRQVGSTNREGRRAYKKVVAD
jgi:hypothetical protein